VLCSQLLVCIRTIADAAANYTDQQNLTLFCPMNLAVLFMLNSDMHTEFFYRAGFKRYRGI